MVTVICSRYETFSRVLTETMSVGCPLVAAKVGGMTEILQDQVDGLFHRPEDRDDLATKIISLMNNPAHAAELGRQAAVTCETRFHPEAVATLQVNFYRRALERFEHS